MLTRVLCVKRPGPCVPYSLLATPYSLPLRNPENLMRLQAEPPARVIEAIAERCFRVGVSVRPVHRLQEEMAESKRLKCRRFGVTLRINQFQLVSGALN